MVGEFLTKFCQAICVRSQARGRDSYIEIDLFTQRGRFGATLTEASCALRELEANGKIEVVKLDARRFLVRPK